VSKLREIAGRRLYRERFIYSRNKKRFVPGGNERPSFPPRENTNADRITSFRNTYVSFRRSQKRIFGFNFYRGTTEHIERRTPTPNNASRLLIYYFRAWSPHKTRFENKKNLIGTLRRLFFIKKKPKIIRSVFKRTPKLLLSL